MHLSPISILSLLTLPAFTLSHTFEPRALHTRDQQAAHARKQNWLNAYPRSIENGAGYGHELMNRAMSDLETGELGHLGHKRATSGPCAMPNSAACINSPYYKWLSETQKGRAMKRDGLGLDAGERESLARRAAAIAGTPGYISPYAKSAKQPMQSPMMGFIGARKRDVQFLDTAETGLERRGGTVKDNSARGHAQRQDVLFPVQRRDIYEPDTGTAGLGGLRRRGKSLSGGLGSLMPPWMRQSQVGTSSSTT